MTEKFTEEDFTRQLGTKFRVSLEGEGASPVELELAEVKPFPTLSHSRRDVERFSLFFYGPEDFFLPQRIYRLEHELLGGMDIFLVPVARDPRGFCYEAVFSFFKESVE
ncbi:MAG TPA: hypothetical protein VHU19_06980 [Pyrinomonadaceae bacterium]|jgi:hypothetical protein|nr:hypothetical protein [Pyrinomonadaceae bacterium]